MRLLVLLTLVGALLMPSAVATGVTNSSVAHSGATAQPGELIPDQYIVALKPGRDARGLARALSVTPKHVYSRVLNGFAARLNAGQRTALERHPDVTLIEPDQIMVATGTQTINATSDNWGLDRIDQRALPLSGSYTYTATGAGVTAYIIDSGVQTNHPEFGTRAQHVYDPTGGTGADCSGHGTHIAGIVGGTTYGVAKQINLRSIRVLQCDAQGFLSDVVRALEWVEINAAKPAVVTLALAPKDVTVGNSPALELAVQDVINSGVFVAVSAGKNGTDQECNLAPASVSAAFTVAASTTADQRYAGSNYGSCVDSYAPGQGIISATIGSFTEARSGASQATAFVAGVAALYKATNGDAPQATINDWLITNSTKNVIQNNPTGTPNRLLYWNGSPRQVNAAYTHSCGIRSDNTLVCWGRNTSGERIPPSGSFTQVSGGENYSCGIRTNQTLACWGNNGSGQATPPSGTFTQIDAGEYHACGVRTDKTVACWGSTSYGKSTPPSGSFNQVSAGYNHSCGLHTDGTVSCWGADTYFQATPPSGSFNQVSAGRDHSCGLRPDSNIVCWGHNDHGQRTAPVGAFIQVAAGDNYSCAMRADRTITCWGYNNYGQATAPSGTFTQVSAYWRHSCGLRTDGSVACWGWNHYGQSTPPTNWY